jgi:hypothetical protein
MVNGLLVVWPQNHSDSFLRFGLKAGGDGFLWFGLKTGGDGSLRFGLKSCGDSCDGWNPQGTRGGFWVGAMLTPAVKPQWVRNKLGETIE